MPSDSAEPSPTEAPLRRNRNIGTISITSIVVSASLIAGAIFLSGCKTTSTFSDQEIESLESASQISFSHLRMSAEENYINQRIVYLDGKISNAGPKMAGRIRVRLTFHDLSNRTILRTEHDLLASRTMLAPGSSTNFQVRFDQIPDSWNQWVPEIQIVSLRVQVR